jgi:hypothetical protein
MKVIAFAEMRRVVSLKQTDVSEVRTASGALMIKAVPTSETWSTSTRLQGAMSQKSVIFIILDCRGMRWRENGGSCTMRNFVIFTHPQISLGKSSQGEWGGRGMWHAWERREKCTRLWRESLKERDRFEDQGVGGKIWSEWSLGRLPWGGCGLDSNGSGQGPVVGFCECGDEPPGSCATELVS